MLTRPRGQAWRRATPPRVGVARGGGCVDGERGSAAAEHPAVMLRLAGVAISVGLADSLNPSTVGPALYLATAQRAVLRVLLFTVGVFAVDVVGGIGLTVGPGRLLL